MTHLVIIKESDEVSGFGVGPPGVDLAQDPVQRSPLAEVSSRGDQVGARHVQNAIHGQLTHQLHLGWIPATIAHMGQQFSTKQAAVWHIQDAVHVQVQTD